MEKRKSQFLKEDYFLDKGIPFLMKGMRFDDIDVQQLNKWGFKKPTFLEIPEEGGSDIYNFSLENQDETTSLLNQERVKCSFEFFSHFEDQLNQFTHSIIKTINSYEIDDLKSIYEQENFLLLIDSLKTFPQLSDDFLLYLNTHSKNTPESFNTYGFGLSALLGMKLKISKNDLRDMLLTSVLSKLFFFVHKIEKLKLMFIKSKSNDIHNPDLKKQQVTYILSMLQKIDCPPMVKYLIVYQYVGVDGSGGFNLDKNKVTIPANILGLVSSYMWRRHPFSLTFFSRSFFDMNEIIQEKNKYYREVLTSFLKTVGFFEPGSIIQLKDQKEERLAIVIHGNGVNKPTVKILFNNEKNINYSQQLVDLNHESNAKWNISLVSLELEKFLSVFKKNINELKYS